VQSRAEQVLDHFRAAAEPAGFAVVATRTRAGPAGCSCSGAPRTLDVTVAALTCPRGASSFTVVLTVP
jgi:predicted pyridoxine 5'-phosphate oxidase superfamily flavin-nucleotide-binding protein